MKKKKMNSISSRLIQTGNYDGDEELKNDGKKEVLMNKCVRPCNTNINTVLYAINTKYCLMLLQCVMREQKAKR